METREGGRYVGDVLEDSRILNIRRLWIVAEDRPTWKRGSLLAVDMMNTTL